MDAYPDVDWLVVACDLPNVGDDTISHLLANRSAEHPFTAYVSSHDGLPEPLCAVWRSIGRGVIRELLGEGIRCPRKILIRSDTHLLAQAVLHEFVFESGYSNGSFLSSLFVDENSPDRLMSVSP